MSKENTINWEAVEKLVALWKAGENKAKDAESTMQTRLPRETKEPPVDLPPPALDYPDMLHIYAGLTDIRRNLAVTIKEIAAISADLDNLRGVVSAAAVALLDSSYGLPPAAIAEKLANAVREGAQIGHSIVEERDVLRKAFKILTESGDGVLDDQNPAYTEAMKLVEKFGL